jgi:pimeloyl-ACP methyl ester carboxylesterase
VGVIGVDTFQDVTVREPEESVRGRAAAFAKDPAASCRAMAAQLFHPGAHQELRSWVEQEMCGTPRPRATTLFESFLTYDLAAACRRVRAPVRAINGDLWPTRVEANRALLPGFEARILAGTGHYPMLEQPDLFNRTLEAVVAALVRGNLR